MFPLPGIIPTDTNEKLQFSMTPFLDSVARERLKPNGVRGVIGLTVPKVVEVETARGTEFVSRKRETRRAVSWTDPMGINGTRNSVRFAILYLVQVSIFCHFCKENIYYRLYVC